MPTLLAIPSIVNLYSSPKNPTPSPTAQSACVPCCHCRFCFSTGTTSEGSFRCTFSHLRLTAHRMLPCRYVLRRMIASFGSGAAFSLVSGMGNTPPQPGAPAPGPLPSALVTGAMFALFQGAFYQVRSSVRPLQPHPTPRGPPAAPMLPQGQRQGPWGVVLGIVVP